MPTLNPQILNDICVELLKGDEYPPQDLNKFALAGKETLSTFENAMASLKSVKIDGSLVIIKFVDKDKTFKSFKPYQIATRRMMAIIGHCTKRISFTHVAEEYVPIIDAICQAQSLQKLTYDSDMAIDGSINPFERILDACFNSIQKIVVPAQYYFDKNPQIFHLRCLYFKSIIDNITEYLNHPSCIAQELIVELDEQEGFPANRWQTITGCFENAQNPKFDSIKKLKLKLHFEAYVEYAFTNLLQSVHKCFPNLQSFTMVNQLDLDESSHTFQDFMNHSLYYEPLYLELNDSSYNFDIDIEWNLCFTVNEPLFLAGYAAACKSFYSDFDIDTESEERILFVKNDELSRSKAISFEIEVLNEID